jgi:hypothetical protein
MGRIWSSGGELNSTSSNVEWTSITNVSYSTSVVRSDSRSILCNNTSSTSGKWAGYDFLSSGGSGPYYLRFYVRFASFPNSSTNFAYFGSIAQFASLDINSDGTLTLRDEDGTIGSPSSALSTDTWYMVELHVDKSGSAGTHTVTGRLNGIEFATSSTRSISNTITTIRLGANLRNEGTNTGTWYFDDVAINDSSGSFQNSWPGEGEIIHLRPNATGDAFTFASTPGGNGWDDIDEVTPDDDTSYMQSTLLDATADVNIDDTPSSLDTTDVINCVQVGIRYRRVTGDEHTFVTRIKATSGGTVEESGNITTSGSGWCTNATANPRNYALTLYDLPGASTTAWSKSTLDSAQIGVRIVADGSNNFRVSTMWLLVDHKPNPTPGGGEVSWRMLTGLGL